MYHYGKAEKIATVKKIVATAFVFVIMLVAICGALNGVLNGTGGTAYASTNLAADANTPPSDANIEDYSNYEVSVEVHFTTS